MATRPLKICAHAGCGTATPDRYCSRHEATHAAERARLDRRRGTSTERGYGAAWRRTRALFLAGHPLCSCGAPATDADHIVPRAQGGSDEFSNLQALCHACHARKTAAMDGGFGNAKRASRGGDGGCGSLAARSHDRAPGTVAAPAGFARGGVR